MQSNHRKFPRPHFYFPQPSLDESVVIRPLISSLEPITALRLEYENGTAAFVKQIDWLIDKGYIGIRRARGDGLSVCPLWTLVAVKTPLSPWRRERLTMIFVRNLNPQVIASTDVNIFLFSFSCSRDHSHTLAPPLHLHTSSLAHTRFSFRAASPLPPPYLSPQQWSPTPQ